MQRPYNDKCQIKCLIHIANLKVGESMTEEGGHDLSASGAGEKKHLLHKSESERESGNN